MFTIYVLLVHVVTDKTLNIYFVNFENYGSKYFFPKVKERTVYLANNLHEFPINTHRHLVESQEIFQ